jgi:hypothetical protein
LDGRGRRATLAAQEHAICIVCDSKAAFGAFSADGAVRKTVPLIYHYAVLFAGNDAAHAGGVISRAKECQIERDKVAEAEILKPHGYDLETFRDKGSELCTDAVFFDIHTELQKKTLSLDFVIAGFDSNNQGHIRFTNCITPPQDYDSIGFWAIGTGAQAALASLSHAVEHLGLSRWDDPEVVLYHTLAAKFMAESARDVGKATDAHIVIAFPSGEVGLRQINPLGGFDYVRKVWEREGAPKRPRGIKERMDYVLINTMKEALSIEKLEKIARYSKPARSFLKIRKKKSNASPKQLVAETLEGQQ